MRLVVCKPQTFGLRLVARSHCVYRRVFADSTYCHRTFRRSNMAFSRLGVSCFLFASFLIEISLQMNLGLPSYITPCRRNDTDLDECATNAAKVSFVQFLQGDPERNITRLDPLYYKEVSASGSGNNLNLVLKDINVYGLSNLTINKVSIDTEREKVTVRATGKIILDSKYELKGKLLLFVLRGKGKSKITLDKTKFKFTCNYTSVVDESDGQEYLKILNSTLKANVGNAHFRFENLFDDKFISDSVHQVLNSAWKELIRDFGPPVTDKINESLTEVFQQFLSTIPYDELLPLD